MTVLKELGLFEAPADKLARQSYPGMAHFAGTGPQGKTCGSCKYFCAAAISKGRAPDQDYCDKYTVLTHGKVGKRIPKEAEACRHFEERPA
jgi:hypothetical protein